MLTLTEKFIRRCLDSSDKEAMRVKTPTGWVSYRYKELLNNARKIAFWLKQDGLQKEEKAAIILDNCPQWSMVYFGVLLSGGVVVPLDPQASTQDIVTFLEDAEAQYVFLENRLLVPLQHHLRRVKKIIVLKREEKSKHCLSLDEIFAKGTMIDTSAPTAVRENDTASLLYSSGTTSNPKGVELSHKNLYANFESVNDVRVCSSQDCFISILPLFHAYAFMATLLYPLFIGARIVYPKTLKSAELVQIIRDNQVTMIVGVPELFNTIHRGISEKLNTLPFSLKVLIKIITEFLWRLRKWSGLNLSKLVFKSVHERFGNNLRHLITGGARLDPKVGLDFEKFGFSILEGYGLTETAPLVTLNPPQKAKIGSVGKLVKGVEVKIINPDSTGAGEIVIKGPNVMKGYYKKPDETAQVIKDGWFYSGDLGYLDKDGYLFISGRLKEVIVLGSGKNIFPDEVEKHYARSKYIKEVGVFLSTQEKAESLRAVIVPDLELFKKNKQINIEEKIRWDVENISKEMTSYKRVMGFVMSKEELPKTRLGKIKRFQLPQIYFKEVLKQKIQAEEISSDGDDTLKTPLGRRMAEFLKKELSLERDILSRDHLELDLGVDSLRRVELIAGFEKLFHVRLPDDILKEVATVADLIEQIDKVLRLDISPEDAKESLRTSWHDILHADTSQEPLVDLEGETTSRYLDYILKGFIFALMKVFFRIKILGRENLPPKGPCILCGNHSSFLDAFVIVTGLPLGLATQTYFIGLKDIFDHPAIRWSTRLARVIPIDPALELVKAMQAAAFVLKHNRILCIFPEGQRSIDGEVKRFKKGVGILAKELEATVIPVAIEGSYRAWPRTSPFPKPAAVTIIFGKPLKYHEIVKGHVSSEDEYKMISDKTREEVVKLKAKVALT